VNPNPGTRAPTSQGTRSRYLWRTLPAFAVLSAIHFRHSLSYVLAGHAPPDLGYAAQSSVTLQSLQVACLLYLFLVYGLTLRHWRRGAWTPRDLAVIVVTLTAAAWTLLPANSADVFDYLGFGRLFALFRLNPYTHTYGELADWFGTYVTWDDAMPYGPSLLPFFSVAGVLAGVNVFIAVYALKLAWAALHLADAWMVFSIAESMSLDATWAAFAFACNPLILLELAGNGHNDAVVIACTLGALLALRRERPAAALALASLGAMSKLPAIVWTGGIAMLLYRRRAWNSLAYGSAIAGILLLIVVFWPGAFASLTVGSSQWHYTEDSLHMVAILTATAVSRAHDWSWDYMEAFRVDRIIATALFLPFVGWLLSGIRDDADLIRECGYLLLALLLLYASAVEPWYLTWLLPVLALTHAATQRRVILTAGPSLLALYAFPYSLVEISPHRLAWTAVRLIVAFGVPIAAWLTA
jgi:hypothetical protein